MKSIENLLYVEVADELEALGEMTKGSDEYRATVDGVTKLMDRALEIEKLHAEDKKELETRGLELTKMRDERIDKWVRNIITGVGTVGGLVLAVWGTKATFKFEENGTITTAIGRSFINKILPRK